ncbi:MAG TPA: Fur family transcriptional regulator [bacterium]|nr:Fur family transcriptional regulator [bacterium]
MKQQAIIHELQRLGLRNTRIRRELVAIFQHADNPLAVPDIARELADRRLYPNKTTLYREVSRLARCNLISELDIGDGKKRYEMQTDHHHHLVCEQCHAITCVPIANQLCQLEEELAIHHDFSISRHTLEFYGTCRKCQKAGGGRR